MQSRQEIAVAHQPDLFEFRVVTLHLAGCIDHCRNVGIRRDLLNFGADLFISLLEVSFFHQGVKTIHHLLETLRLQVQVPQNPELFAGLGLAFPGAGNLFLDNAALPPRRADCALHLGEQLIACVGAERSGQLDHFTKSFEVLLDTIGIRSQPATGVRKLLFDAGLDEPFLHFAITFRGIQNPATLPGILSQHFVNERGAARESWLRGARFSGGMG
ncbi:MAG: hypothetical protein K8R36_06030 [Planctomycetales bacterium]|nr:hypothetical protein [Planctomycetales bacterium]